MNYDIYDIIINIYPIIYEVGRTSGAGGEEGRDCGDQYRGPQEQNPRNADLQYQS